MKTFSLLNTALFTLAMAPSAYAEEWYLRYNQSEQTPNYQQCINGTQNGKEQLEVAKTCVNYALQAAGKTQKSLSTDKKFFAMGIGNMLFIRKLVDEKNEKSVDKVISGEYSMIQNIHSVLISNTGKEVFVFDNSSQPKILVFDINKDGNVGPSRVFEPDWIKGISQMTLDKDPKKLILYSASREMYYILENSGDSRSPAAQHKLKFVETKFLPKE